MKSDILKKRIRNAVNILFICIVGVFLVAGLVRTVFFPKDINYYENRYSNKLIKPTIGSILDASFQDSVEDALSDQVPRAQVMKKYYNDTNSAFISVFVNPILEANDGTYINYNGTKLFGCRYVYECKDLELIKPTLDSKAENYNEVFEKYPEIDYYVYFIEKDTDMNFETGEKINADEYIFSKLNLDDSQMRSYEIESFSDFEENFYKTDHHWNHKGSYTAYKDIANFLGCTTPIIENKKEVLISEEFMGSKAAATGSNLIVENFSAYEFDFPQMTYMINGSLANDYGAQSDFISGESVLDATYGSFYGGDDGEIIFDSGNEELDNILIIGESYDNAVLKLLATHFNRTHSIDLRNYEHFLGTTFDYGKYIADNDIDKVLFVGNADFYILDTFELEIH